MFAVANKQQFKIKMYKKQIEEAGEIIAFILAKFREAQQELEEANKQQFRKEQDNKEGHEKEHGNFCLKHSLKRDGRECERGRDPSLPLLFGICLWQADDSSFTGRHLFVTGRCLSGRVLVKRPNSHFLFTIVVIKNHWSLVLNDT